jgi:hypothetical protein
MYDFLASRENHTLPLLKTPCHSDAQQRNFDQGESETTLRSKEISNKGKANLPQRSKETSTKVKANLTAKQGNFAKG